MARAALPAAAAVAAAVAACVAVAWAYGAPIVPEDAGRAGGEGGTLFLAALVAGFSAYLVAVRAVSVRAPALRLVLVAAVAIQLLPLAGPLLLSTDAWTYWEYGRIAAVHEADPYLDAPREFPADPAYDHAGADWRDTTSVYGPLFTLLSEGVALVAGSSAAAAAWVFKAIAGLAVLACALLAARLSRDRALAVALVGWNPLFAIHFGGGGHNDALLMALTLGALAAAAARRPALAAAGWVAAFLVKWVPVVFFALRVLEARSTGRRVSHRAFATAVVLLAGAATLRYGLDWLRAFAPLSDNALDRTSYALPSRLEQAGVPEGVALALAAAVLAAGLAWLTREALRWRAWLGLAACLLLVTTPWLNAWHAFWALPLAAAEDDRRAQVLALALCAYLLPQAIPL